MKVLEVVLNVAEIIFYAAAIVFMVRRWNK